MLCIDLYAYRVSSFSTGFAVIGKFYETTNPDSDKDVAIEPGIEAYRTDWIVPVGFFSPSPYGCIPQRGKGRHEVR